MLSVSVVMPAQTAKIASKSLYSLKEFYTDQENPYAIKICEAAIECKAQAYKITHKAKNPPKDNLRVPRIHFVTLTLEFDNAQDAGKFISLYSKAILS